MTLAEITYESVIAAIAIHHRLGQEQFLDEYGFAPARTYRLAYGGRLYDSKAIVGVAHGEATGVYWTAKDFSGGQATVGRTLARLGFTIDITTDPGSAESSPTSEVGALDELTRLRIAIYAGQPAPYQYVVLLWAIARARDGAARMVRFSDVAEELRGVLAPFSVGASVPNPADPWAALRDSQWWQLDLPTGGTAGGRARDAVLAADPAAGLSPAVYKKIQTDIGWAGQAVDVITRIIGDHPAYENLLGELGLSTVRTLAPSGVIVRSIPVENNVAERYTAGPATSSPQQRRRAESVLQSQYAEHLVGLGHRVGRRHIVVDGADLFTDLHDETTRTLIEVKSSVDRMTVRLALGQILDYARHFTHDHKVVLLPEKPAEDLITLLDSHRVSVVWPGPAASFDTAAART